MTYSSNSESPEGHKIGQSRRNAGRIGKRKIIIMTAGKVWGRDGANLQSVVPERDDPCGAPPRHAAGRRIGAPAAAAAHPFLLGKGSGLLAGSSSATLDGGRQRRGTAGRGRWDLYSSIPTGNRLLRAMAPSGLTVQWDQTGWLSRRQVGLRVCLPWRLRISLRLRVLRQIWAARA